jgi:agmatinase
MIRVHNSKHAENWLFVLVAPATGTPETGGWSTRELRTIIRGLEGINFIATDIVEVAPAYDTNAELTTMAAADVLYEVMTLMVKKGPLSIAEDEEVELEW